GRRHRAPGGAGERDQRRAAPAPCRSGRDAGDPAPDPRGDRRGEEGGGMKPASFDYEQPRDLAAALRLLAGNENAKGLAAGQPLGPMLNLRVVYPGLLVDVSRLPELRDVQDCADTLVLGAGTTHAEIEDGEVPDATRGMMRRVAHNIAYRAV